MARSADEEAVQGIKDPKARKEAYYTRQRQNAKVGSDLAGKIAKKENIGDSIRGFAKDNMQKIMASGPWSIPGEGRAAEAVEGGAKALASGAAKLGKRAGTAIEESVQRLRTPTPVKKALGKGQVKMNAGGPHTPKAVAPAKPSAISTGKNRAITSSTHPAAKASTGPRLTGTNSSQKALSSSGHGEWHAEATKQAGRKLPSQPKTFNRNGTKRAEGRQKSDRNPVSARAKPKSTAKSKHMAAFG
jgi:hypothetical protein